VAAGAKRFLFVSSGAVYGKQPPEMAHIPESYLGSPDPMDPNSAYGEGKRVGELLCAIARQEHGLEATIARCFAFVGPHLPLDAHFAIGNFIRDAMNGKPIKVKDGSPFRSYLYASDLTIWLWTILFKGKPCRPYHVGSDQEISINDLAATVANLTGAGSLLGHSSNPIVSISRYVPATRATASELALAKIIDLREALKKTILYYNQNSNERN
jgi:dTDP-glucose 4,6-dehydratase